MVTCEQWMEKAQLKTFGAHLQEEEEEKEDLKIHRLRK